MHGVLSWQRTHTHKNHILAQYHPDSNTVCVEKVKSQHFQTIGRAKGGKEWLLPEEALFMIERGSLDCRWPVKKEEGDVQTIRVAFEIAHWRLSGYSMAMMDIGEDRKVAEAMEDGVLRG